MALAPGTRLGAYEIVSSLGEGGMGEVYRALDHRLNRQVALKVLPAAVAADADRLARFEREAQILAALNHSNIAAIYGVEETGTAPALVMELVEGPTLADRIAEGPICLDEALPLAKQIAEALEAAHEQGIIHRDLKPANIKLRSDGTVKVLDFGLAKAIEPAGEAPGTASKSLSPTITSPALLTGGGMILGTAAYMSPEQATGAIADRRSDIWAFGVVLYEMLTGRPAFEGEGVAGTLARVIEREPDWAALPFGVPAPLATLLRRCLKKDRRSRINHMSAVLFVLAHVAEFDPSVELATAGRQGAVPQPLWRRIIPATAALCVGALLAGAGTWLMTRPAESAGPAAYLSTYVLPEDLRIPLPPRPAASGRFALSPDGRRLAFVATDRSDRTQLWVRALDSLTAEPLAGTDGASFPFWSPDSRSIAFVVQNTLKKIDVLGGPPVTLSTPAADGRGAWSADDVILFSPDGISLSRVSGSSGASSPMAVLDLGPGQRIGLPFFLPDGRHFLYTVRNATGDPAEVFVGSLDPQEKSRRLLAEAASAMYAQGHVIFQRGTTLMAQAFDPQGLTLSGDGTPIAEQIDVAGGLGNAGAFSVSASGLLAYQSVGGDVRSQLVWTDRSGRQLGALGEPVDQVGLALSPSGARAAVSVLDPARNTRDLWIYDVPRGVRTRFTSDPGDEILPVWSPDESQVAYGSLQKGSMAVYQRSSDGVGEPTALLEGPGSKYLTSWSPDGKSLMYFNGLRASPRTQQDLWVFPVGGTHTPKAFIQTDASEGYAQFSPDGGRLAYGSEESGRREIYLTPFPGPGERTRVSSAGGGYPRWRGDGKELFYLSPGNEVVAVDIDGLVVRAVRPLFGTRPRSPDDRGLATGYGYDVSKDGQRFLINVPVGQATPAPITLLVNWTAALKR